MSGIQIDFPNCGAITSTESREVITVTTENCAPPGPPPLFGVGEIVGVVIISLAFIVAAAIVRYKAHENRPELMQAKNDARQQEIAGEIEMAKQRKVCLTCGDTYAPELKKK